MKSGTNNGTILCPFPKTYKYNPHIFTSPTLILLNNAQKYSINIKLNLYEFDCKNAYFYLTNIFLWNIMFNKIVKTMFTNTITGEYYGKETTKRTTSENFEKDC